MASIEHVKLELLRGGPAHNQLLSPLTPYLALCGAEGPVTIRVPFEHNQLLVRLERLRYETEGNAVAQAQREAEVHDLGRAIGEMLGQVPGLLTELSRRRGEHGELVHLRLSATAQELALVPFELALGAEGFPGCGSPLFLQSIAPVALTREVRRGRPLRVAWDRTPRLLFAFASPEGLPPVPAQVHLEALRRAIDPWIKWYPELKDRVEEVKKHVTVLPDASLQQIRQACEQTHFTHVHVLAHGALDARTGRYCLALRADGGAPSPDLVDGSALLMALTARDSSGALRPSPTVVSLATCDSGNVGSVVTAGASIAHTLHTGGIPWVFASQFPLWMRASSIAAEVLYKGLLCGDDPRWVAYALRQRLRTEAATTHDWASIVVYAEVPETFDQAVDAFRERQTRQRLEIKFDHAERLAGLPVEQAALYDEIRRDLEHWWGTLPATASASARAERLGMRAAAEKRIGILMSKNDPEGARSCYEKSRDYYERALHVQPTNHWVAAQYLSMQAVLLGENDKRMLQQYFSWWRAVHQISSWDLRSAKGDARAWALATMAELELLGVVYNESYQEEAALQELQRRCREISDAVDRDSFPVASTRRQFGRYANEWRNASWKKLAESALSALPNAEPWVARAYQPGILVEVANDDEPPQAAKG